MRPPLLFEAIGPIGRLVLNAPPQNVMAGGFFEAFDSVLDEVHAAGCRGLVIHGAGRHFSSGADIGELVRSTAHHHADSFPRQLERNICSFSRIGELGIPVAAAIRGVCLGSGFELALWAHVRVCGPRAVMGLPETDFALMPGCGGTLLLPKLVGRAKALELILTGHRFGPTEGQALGLIDAIATRGEVIETAVRIVARIAGVSLDDDDDGSMDATASFASDRSGSTDR